MTVKSISNSARIAPDWTREQKAKRNATKKAAKASRRRNR